MANTKSAKKRAEIAEKRRVRNFSVKARLKTQVKAAMAAIDAKDKAKIKTTLTVALSEIDKAATKGVIHKNSAARKKSTLQRLAGAIQ
jgi:small subunit ribosomal protein S20